LEDILLDKLPDVLDIQQKRDKVKKNYKHLKINELFHLMAKHGKCLNLKIIQND
jgi:hypothetical protein